MKKTKIKLWTGSIWEEVFPETDARVVHFGNNGTNLEQWHQTTNSAIKELFSETNTAVSTAQQALHLAAGATGSTVFLDYEDMYNSFKYDSPANLTVGQHVLIIKLNVPDLWISKVDSEFKFVDYTTDEDFLNELAEKGSVQLGRYHVSALETQKVVLSDYLRKNDDASTLPQVYGKSADGVSQWMVNYSTGVTGGALVQRNSTGTITSVYPNNDSDVTTKAYVKADFVARDKTSSNIVYGKEGGAEKVYDVNQGVTPNTIARRTDYGGLRCVTRYENDATTKGYVDGGFVAKPTTEEEKTSACETIGAVRALTPRKGYGDPDPLLYGVDDNHNPKTYKVSEFASASTTEKFLRIWVPIMSASQTVIQDTAGRNWTCQYQAFENYFTKKRKVEYALTCEEDLLATADVVSFSVLGMGVTLGAKYRAATIAYSSLPTSSWNGHWSLDTFTWDEQTDIASECTTLPFRGSGGFEVKVLTWTDSPASSITFKRAKAKITRYEN